MRRGWRQETDGRKAAAHFPMSGTRQPPALLCGSEPVIKTPWGQRTTFPLSSVLASWVTGGSLPPRASISPSVNEALDGGTSEIYLQLTFCDQCRAQLMWGRSPNKGSLSRRLGSHGVSHLNTASPRWGLWESHHLLVSKRCLLRLSQLKAGEGGFWVSTCVHFPSVDTLSLGCLSCLFLPVSKAT